ncbi:unnamed protein product [Bemisia tabaci]|uniref:Uncharacterized protein n=1 Tax=Bemisia tabaci TaxID=7038 RepID=A0A9P0AFK5_BEMTA|nr:PREDICTED: uncharacterized protein LOC109035538 [Bemisia tabaci]CAH0389680.1 unnamed protein product [Bemisia tabaci]
MGLQRESKFFVLVSLLCIVHARSKKAVDEDGFQCPNTGTAFNTTLAAYFPDYESGQKSDLVDSRGKKLRTLQDFLDDRAEYVTASMDAELHIEYGTQLCLPELNHHFGRFIPIEVRDSSIELTGLGFGRVDICVRTEEDSYDNSVNRDLTTAILQE